MNNPADYLERLRADLQHFEETGDIGENPTVLEIKDHLVRRITELESAMRRTKELESTALPVPPEKSE
jgi:hypothetical protein